MALCVRHMKAVYVNGINIQETTGWEGVSLRRIGSDSNGYQINANRSLHDYATGVYNFGSLLNHSCDPSARRVNDLSKGKMSVLSIRPLRPGDEITIAYYGYDYLNDNWPRRQNRLEAMYNFKCGCVACKKDWPMIKKWIAQSHKDKADFKCKTAGCTGILGKQEMEKFSPKKKCGKVKVKGHVNVGRKVTPHPDPEVWECKTCGQTFQMDKVIHEWKILLNKFHEQANKCFTRNQPLEAIPIFKEFLDFSHPNVVYPFPEICYASDTLIRCIHLVIYFSEGKYF